MTWPHFPNEKIKAHEGFKTVSESQEAPKGGGVGGDTETRAFTSWSSLLHPAPLPTPPFSTSDAHPLLSGQGEVMGPWTPWKRAHKNRTCVHLLGK